jgi:signal transduction histidine kinase
LFKVQLSDLLNAFEKDAPQVYYQYFGKNDGMDITEMNGGCLPCALVMKNKTISFPTMDGLLWVNPETANPLMPEGNIFIDRFIVDGKVLDPEQETHLVLPATTREILIQVGFSAWCNKENIILEYRLACDEKWQPVDVQNGSLINLSNLPHGNYRVQIRKMNGFGVNNYSYKTVVFTITTPWNKQWWFYALVAAAIAALGLLFLRFRTRQYKIHQVKLEQQVREKTKELQQQNEMLEKNNTIKTRLISIISHDIVTPLKFLNVAGQNLVEKKQLMSEELQQETIKEITNTSQELQLLSTNILNWIKYQNENRQLVKEILPLHNLVNQVLGVLQSLARQKKLNLVNAVNKDLTLFQYLEPLKILVYNLVTNAINFTDQGDIVISAASTTQHITVSVKDSGAGMTPEQVRNIMGEQIIISSANKDNRRGNGLGYLIIKDLVKMTGATLHIQSKKGEGTEVFIEFPLMQL